MPVYRCPNKNCDSKEFSASFSVFLDMDNEAAIDEKSFDATTAEIDSYSAVVCRKCGYSDCERAFEI